ncbi:MAG: hypothetical protein IRZ05_04150 [Micromonosporaceae bacterium]|nr:hypothetical protein [Micromonosporaceae bacterium]
MVWWRRPRLPADRKPPLERDERVVAWAQTGSGEVVVATNRGLFLPGRTGRLPWHEIHKAVWSGRELVVTPARMVEQREGYVIAEDLPSEGHLLIEPHDLPRQVYTRVTRSVAYTAHHPVPGGGVRVVARRVSGVDGLTWTVRYDPGTDRDSAAVRQRTAELVAQARAAG